jgi:hypothetical protein
MFLRTIGTRKLNQVISPQPEMPKFDSLHDPSDRPPDGTVLRPWFLSAVDALARLGARDHEEKDPRDTVRCVQIVGRCSEAGRVEGAK